LAITIIGFFVLLIGATSVYFGTRAGIMALTIAMIFGASAAILLPSLGGNSVPPSHLMLVFLAIGIMLRPFEAQACLRSLAYPGAGFWFAAYALFSVMSAMFLPRIFEGVTLVYSSTRDASEMMSPLASPLQPGSSNLTQSVYMLGNLFCLAVVGGLIQLGHGNFVARAFVIAAAICFVFAGIDVLSFFTGQADLLDFLRNASYTMHTAETFAGFKRIVGTFPEASVYGAVALAFVSFTVVLWLERYPMRGLGYIALAGGISVALCTSTTAYSVSLLMMVYFIAFALRRTWQGQGKSTHFSFLAAMLLVVPIIIMGSMLVPEIWRSVVGLFDAAFANKLDSQSGEERTAWNTLALMAFLDTGSFGAGLGSVRASSFVVALLSNVGLPGTVLFGLFAYRLFLRPISIGEDREAKAIRMAAIASCISQIASATVSSSGTDLGLMFSITAAMAVGRISQTETKRTLPQLMASSMAIRSLRSGPNAAGRAMR
jgi:hypothetical protein